MTIHIDLDQLEAAAKAATPDTWFAFAAARPEVVLALIERLRKAEAPTPPADDVREALGAIWDDGNATGLDGWVGPGRGTTPIDPEAVEARHRAIEKHGNALDVRPRGTVTDAEVDVVWRTLVLDDAGHLTRGNVRAALKAARGTNHQDGSARHG